MNKLRDEIEEERKEIDDEMVKASARNVVVFEEKQKEEQKKIEERLCLLGKVMDNLENGKYTIDKTDNMLWTIVENEDGKSLECRFKFEIITEHTEDADGKLQTSYSVDCLTNEPQFTMASTVSVERFSNDIRG